jgi:hypothetical protein
VTPTPSPSRDPPRVVVLDGADPVPRRPAAPHLPVEHGGRDDAGLRRALRARADERATPRSRAAYLSFLCGVAVWGWHELAFLTGFVTGPRATPCPPGATGWRRFGYAAETLIFHELAILLTALLLVLLTRDGVNQVGTGAFLLLWLLRLSAKLNLFPRRPEPRGRVPAGPPALPAQLPGPARHERPVPRLRHGGDGGAGSPGAAGGRAGGERVRRDGLRPSRDARGAGALEHWFLVLPLPVAALWRWGFRSRAPESRRGPRP